MATEHLNKDGYFRIFRLFSLTFRIFPRWKWFWLTFYKGKYGVVQTVSPILKDFLFLAIEIRSLLPGASISILFLWANPVPYLFIFRSTSHGGFRGCFCNNQSRESCGHPLFTRDRQPKLFTFTWPPRLQAQAHVFCSPPYSAAFRPILMLVNLLRV